MPAADDPPAIPLWINGHAFLTLSPAFHDVKNRLTGEVVRRTPMCGYAEAKLAVEAARLALKPWEVQGMAARSQLLAALGEALTTYGEHFSGLIAEETGKGDAAAAVEVASAAALLQTPDSGEASGVLAVVGNDLTPLLGALRLLVPALNAGAAVVIRPSPATPSALFALAELSGRCGFPAGILSIVHGGDAALDGLRTATENHVWFS